MKLHLGNGTVYLDGWVNIDLGGELAADRPDLVEHNRTTVDKYFKYKYPENISNKVTDIHVDMRNLSAYADNSVDEMLSVNTISHIPKEECLAMLREWHRALKPGGTLIIDNADRKKQAQLLVDATTFEETDWALRLFYCHHKTELDIHHWGFTPTYLQKLLEDIGFKHLWTRTDYIVHDMSDNFQICVTK